MPNVNLGLDPNIKNPLISSTILIGQQDFKVGVKDGKLVTSKKGATSLQFKVIITAGEQEMLVMDGWRIINGSIRHPARTVAPGQYVDTCHITSAQMLDYIQKLVTLAFSAEYPQVKFPSEVVNDQV
jgi:DNA-binding cell septation regulator SpoVG